MDSMSEAGMASETVLHTDLEPIVAKVVEAAVKVVREEFNHIVHDLKQHISQLKERIVCAEGMTNSEASETDAIIRENRKLSVWANEVDQYGCRNHIRIQGLKMKKDDDCRQVVTDFVRGSLKVLMTDDDISVRNSRQSSSSSAMSQPNTSKKPMGSAVIVRFQRRKARDKVTSQRRLLTSIPAKARLGRPYCPINLILTLSPSLTDY